MGSWSIKLVLVAYLMGATVAVAGDGKDIGKLGGSSYDPASTSNPYNLYHPDSVNNDYGRYGSPYSNQSPNNPYATDPPVLRGGESHDGSLQGTQ